MRFNVEELQERIAPLFQENFQRFGEVGAALSIWRNGEPLLDLQGGLCALDENVEVTDYDAVIHALEKQRPLWRPGIAHGYHARSFGFLIDELMRRICGTSISKYWRTIFAEALSLDFWIGLPEELNS